MASCPDFAVEKSDLEHLADELGCIVNFTAKYHCEIAGEGVENGWGFSKKIYRRLPISKKRYLDVFTKSVKDCLIQVTPEQARRFSRCCRKYMLAYQKIVDEADGESTATASLEWIETLVDTCFVATTNSSKKKAEEASRLGTNKEGFSTEECQSRQYIAFRERSARPYRGRMKKRKNRNDWRGWIRPTKMLTWVGSNASC
jgi:hypothetical protein